MPAHIRWASLVANKLLPEKGFRYLDIGCGQGLNLIMAALSYPESHFVGLDIDAEHIRHGQSLAKLCGAENVVFVQGDVGDRAVSAQPDISGQSFDYIVCHGLSTWVSREVREGIIKFAAGALKASGVFYNSYNTLPGWLDVIPYQNLVKMLLEQGVTPSPLESARAILYSISAVIPGYMSSYPMLESRLRAMATEDPAYLINEYGSRHWRPMFANDMHQEHAACGMSYLQSCTLAEAFEVCYPGEILKILDGIEDESVSLQVKDYVLHQTFRRDLFSKTKPEHNWSPETVNAIARYTFIVYPDGLKAFMRDGLRYGLGCLRVSDESGTLELVVDALQDELIFSVRELSIKTGLSLQMLVPYLSILIQVKAIHFYVHRDAHRPMKELVRLFLSGGQDGLPYESVPSPALGGAIRTTLLPPWVLEELQADASTPPSNGRVSGHHGDDWMLRWLAAVHLK